MILVADCSALIALSVCDSLDLLEHRRRAGNCLYRSHTARQEGSSQTLKAFLQGKIRQVDMQTYIFLDAFANAGETEAMLL